MWIRFGKQHKKEDERQRDEHNEYVIALAGNPNTGKSTIFNALTGLNQHTGNWSGKTVIKVQGRYRFKNKVYLLVDLPGTYSLFTNSIEEEIARDFICFQRPDLVVVVVNAACLERNLNLVLQVLEITSQVVVCVNLLDEAKRKNIRIDLPELAKELGVPVVGTVARKGNGLRELKQTIENLLLGRLQVSPQLPVYDKELEEEIAGLLPSIHSRAELDLNPRWLALRILEGDDSVFTRIKSLERFEYPGVFPKEGKRYEQATT